MHGTALRQLLSASLDTEVPTSTIRLAAGLVHEITRKLAIPVKPGEPPRTEAYISWDQVEELTGVDRSTANKHMTHLANVGVVWYAANGNQRRQNGKATAGAWTLSDAGYAPLDIALTDNQEQVLCDFLNPTNAFWSRKMAGNSGFRAMWVSVATYGFKDVLLSGPTLARLLGVTRDNGRLALKALENLGVVWREGRSFRLHTSILENPMWQNWDRYNPETRWKQEAHRKKWDEQHEVWMYGETLEQRSARQEESKEIMWQFFNAGVHTGPTVEAGSWVGDYRQVLVPPRSTDETPDTQDPDWLEVQYPTFEESLHQAPTDLQDYE